MPTVLRVGPYRIGFFSADRKERPHVHVVRDDKTAKFWLDSLQCARSSGFKTAELNAIGRIVAANRHVLLEKWRENFKSK